MTAACVGCSAPNIYGEKLPTDSDARCGNYLLKQLPTVRKTEWCNFPQTLRTPWGWLAGQTQHRRQTTFSNLSVEIKKKTSRDLLSSRLIWRSIKKRSSARQNWRTNLERKCYIFAAVSKTRILIKINYVIYTEAVRFVPPR